ncbi:MAG TPA: 30S ribosomal protein S5 [Candidatus Diapherotrites archaeon]|uniref:Small ribosomal subunit protein uS5 n=1 Tax=Candidatus Iainarchaeum sp. TaxID=3101447 RepID=A0A7J4IXS3_9ARCH|nr:30S ribosomal protein S5 [Candidatus Diapherotrites archaeon]
MQGRPRRAKRELSSEEIAERREETRERAVDSWVPSTRAGKMVKAGEITSIDDLFAKGLQVMEPEIVDVLLPGCQDKLIEFRKTARITRQGRSFSFRAAVLVGDKDSYIGLGTAKDKERYPAINKATRKAKMAIRKIRKGCGSWECRCRESHSVPFKVEGTSSSVRVMLMPAPKGTGLVVGENIKDVLRYVGIRDVWSKCRGNTASTLDFVAATVNALAATSNVKFSADMARKLEEKR